MKQHKKVTISGSFTRDMKKIGQDTEEFKNLDYEVLSPISVNVVKELSHFMYVDGDVIDDSRRTQDLHFRAIDKSDFLWIVAPDGRPGQSTCMEMGYAYGIGKKMYTKDTILDTTLHDYCDRVQHPDEAIRNFKRLHSDWDWKRRVHRIGMWFKNFIQSLFPMFIRY